MKHITVAHLPKVPAQGVYYVLLPNKNRSEEFYHERTDRNIGWITQQDQNLIKGSIVGIAGCGGMGGLTASAMIRLGIGEIRIADNEVFDISNLNRQFAATLQTLNKSKALETGRMLRSIADDSTLVVYPQGIDEDTVESFVDGCDIICDEIEFWAVGSRILLHNTMRKKGGIILTSPTVGHRAYVFKFTPDSLSMEETLGMTYAEAMRLQTRIFQKKATEKEMSRVMEAMLHFAAPEIPEYSADTSSYRTASELRVRLFQEMKASIIATNPQMASGILGNQILFHILEKSDIRRNFKKCPIMPGYIMFDAGHVCLQIIKRTTLW